MAMSIIWSGTDNRLGTRKAERMSPLIRLTVVVAMMVAPSIGSATVAQPTIPAHPAPASMAAFVTEAAQRFDIPETWIWAVIRIESRGDPHAVSSAGAMGLMQLMPATWATMRARCGLGVDPFDPHDNIIAGTAFLRVLHDRYGNPAAMLAAYNAGPARYDDWLARHHPLPQETVAYLARLSSVTGGAADGGGTILPPPDPLAWTRAALFAPRASDTAAAHLNADATASEAAPDRRAEERTPVTFAVVEPPSTGLFVPVGGGSRQ